MKIYKDSEGKYFELLYVQNEKNPRGGGTPSVEPTVWFQPMQVKMRGRIPEGFEKAPGAWPVPLAENLVARVLSEFTGRIPTPPTVPGPKAEPAKGKKEDDE